MAKEHDAVARLLETSPTVVDGLAVDLSEHDAYVEIADWVENTARKVYRTRNEARAGLLPVSWTQG